MSPEGKRLEETKVAIYLRDYTRDYRTNLRKQAKEIGLLVKTDPEWTTLTLYIDHTGHRYGEPVQKSTPSIMISLQEGFSYALWISGS